MNTVCSFRGPDPYFPFLGQVKEMRFQLGNMDPKGERSVISLSQRTADGVVLVMRVNNVDFVYTWSKKAGVYIILVPDMKSGLQIQVFIAPNNYTFKPIENLSIDNPDRNQFGKEDGREFCPCIFKNGNTNYANVGPDGAYDDWHYKYYIVDCSNAQEISGKEQRWLPPGQISYKAFGTELNPPWYGMSAAVAHGSHPCYERGIDQSKRLYTPFNTVVNLGGKIICDLPVLSEKNGLYDFQYPSIIGEYFGRNAYGKVKGEIVDYGVCLLFSSVVTPTNPDVNDPILYFWPWIPYMDEIRSLNLLTYSSEVVAGNRLLPALDAFAKWNIGRYSPNAPFASSPLVQDQAEFSQIPTTHDQSVDSEPKTCACCGACCDLGHFETHQIQTAGPYNSKGSKSIPIGIIGDNLPIIMKNEWQQNADGPNLNVDSIVDVTGNLPYNNLNSPVSGPAQWYGMCCVQAFENDNVRKTTTKQSANNKMDLIQTLMVGEDVIFSGKSSLAYDMKYSGEDDCNSKMQITVDKYEYPKLSCTGSINHTTTEMSINQTQSLSVGGAQDGLTYYWQLTGGGSLSATKGQSTVYTAPASNPDCNDNATILLFCNDERVKICNLPPDCSMVQVASLTINITIIDNEVAYEINTNCHETCAGNGDVAFPYTKTQYKCDDTVYATLAEQVCSGSGFSTCAENILYLCNPYCGMDDCCASSKAPIQNVAIDHRTQAMKDAGCCPAALM